MPNTKAPDLTSQLVNEIAAVLSQRVEVVDVNPAGDLCAVLERFIPAALHKDYSEWAGESLDGVFVAYGIRRSEASLELLGTCILLSDQTRAPLHAVVELTSARDAVLAYEFRIGEPGGGPLGISGPPTGSGQASRLHDRLRHRFEHGQVDWVYETSFRRLGQ